MDKYEEATREIITECLAIWRAKGFPESQPCINAGKKYLAGKKDALEGAWGCSYVGGTIYHALQKIQPAWGKLESAKEKLLASAKYQLKLALTSPHMP